MARFHASWQASTLRYTFGNIWCTEEGGELAGVLWPLEPATEAKHRLYRSYLDAWWPIMLQPIGREGWLRPRITYVDAFAGPGRYEGGEPGSPVLALRRLLDHVARERMHLSRERVCLVFMEKDRRRFEFLRRELVEKFGDLESLPVRVEVRNADAGRDMESILDEVGAWEGSILSVFDSWGNVSVPLSLVRRIATQGTTEVITTFGPNWFSRRQDEDPSDLDEVFGGHEYWQPADMELRPEERWRVWLATYREAMTRAGFTHHLQFKVVPRTGQPLYLVFGTKNVRGVEVMKDAMWKVDVSDGMSFADPRTRGATLAGQLGLFGAASGSVEPEVMELVEQRLRGGGSATVEQIGDWLTLETARWRSKDAANAVKEMREAGTVSVDPGGRITKASTVRLLGNS